MKITIAQLNPVVGDIEGNMARLIDTLSHYSGDTDLIVFPELFLAGYPPRDLLERGSFINKIRLAIDKIVVESVKFSETGLLFGAPITSGENTGKGLYNSALLVYQGRILLSQHKSLLPTYDVFDEARYFDPAPSIQTIPFKGETLGISICEDAWNDPELWPKRKMYAFDPIEELAVQGANLLINISASPFYVGKEEIRYRLIQNHARKYKIPFIYVNQVGANDELIFDGRSIALDKKGEPLLVCKAFQEEIKTVDTGEKGIPGLYKPQGKIEAVYQALVLGVRDYMKKSGFNKAVIGLSGGIDSALVCCIAKEAVGAENVLGISMPSPYSSRGSVEDSRKLAANLGVEFRVVPITGIYQAYLDTLKEHFAGREADTTEENIQARIRGNILMAFSNKYGYLVLSTGNKSEMAVGYCTLYGDMSGGLSVISDVPKTMVYELAKFINRHGEIIPQEIIDKAPSAELRPNQTDQDTLPPYPYLDKILQLYIEEGYSAQDLVEEGFDAETVKWVIKTVEKNEYKRRQAAPGLKVNTKAFGTGRRIPLAAKRDS
ncbi:MAG: synthetase [Peptococcaceae bacterium]|jgi:NAD+ synthase (glutamine-hydrolysing)|nr:synthetase [Peptococcaceae bacterium]